MVMELEQKQNSCISETDGSVVTFLLCDAGKGYTYPPEIKVVDNSNHGKGCDAKTTVSNGSIQSIYIVSPVVGIVRLI